MRKNLSEDKLRNVIVNQDTFSELHVKMKKSSTSKEEKKYTSLFPHIQSFQDLEVQINAL